MKLLRMTAACLLVCAVMLSAISVLSAARTTEKDKVKFLKNVALVLRHSNPDISTALIAFANEEQKERSGDQVISAGSESGASGNKINRREERMKLLRDAAQAIQVTDPKSARRLNKWADLLERKSKSRDEEDLDEIEETELSVPVNQENS